MDDITNSMDMSLSQFQEIVKDRETWHAAGHGVAKSRTRLSNFTSLHFPSLADLPKSEIEPGFPALQADSLLHKPLEKFSVNCLDLILMAIV